MVFLSEGETVCFAAQFAEKLRGGDVVLLKGDLGAGKSVFARSLIRTLAGDSDIEVPSPTFTLVQTYDTPKGEVWHFDLYRLKNPDEVFELGWEDALAGGIVLVEWPERLGPYLPKTAQEISFIIEPDGSRKVDIK